MFITYKPGYLTYSARSPNHSKEHIMKTNEGTIDRALRVIAGLALIGLTVSGTIGVWGYIGVVPLLTGIIGICPAYSILGLNTCPMKK
jgi:hypothetical protein